MASFAQIGEEAADIASTDRSRMAAGLVTLLDCSSIKLDGCTEVRDAAVQALLMLCTSDYGATDAHHTHTRPG